MRLGEASGGAVAALIIKAALVTHNKMATFSEAEYQHKNLIMQFFFKNKYFVDFMASIMFFTRIPVKWSYFSNKAPDLTNAAWTFPLIGFIIGFLSGGIGDWFISLGLSIFLSSVISITISVLLTGAFHEDGLADTSDGLGAGGSEKKLIELFMIVD